MRNILLPVLGLVVLLAPVDRASAHASPVLYNPASASVIQSIPETVSIRFTERIEKDASTIIVYAPDGSPVQKGPVSVSATDPRTLSVALRGAGSGTYAVSWQVISADDGHFTKGGFVFSVGQTSANALAGEGQFQVHHRSEWPEAILTAVEFLGGALLVGILGMLILLRKFGAPSSLLRRRLFVILTISAVLFLLGDIGYVFLKSGNLSVDRSIDFADGVVTFLGTFAGRYTVYRMVTGVLAAAFLVWHLRMRSNRLLFGASLACVLLMALLRARVSHAAASEFLPGLSITVNAVHLLAKDLWIGGIAVLVIAMLPAFDRLRDPKKTAGMLLAFSRMTAATLAVGGVTGCYIVWLHLKGVANLFTTHWGGTFITLAVYGLLLLVFRLYHQLVLLPQLIKGSPAAQKETASSGGFFLLMESGIGVAVLLFSGMLLITTPPLTRRIEFQKTVQTTVGTVTVGESPSEDDQFLVTVNRLGLTGTGAVTVLLENAEKGIGPIVAPLEQRSANRHVFSKTALTPAGHWKISVTEQRPGAFDVVGSVMVSVPNDLQIAEEANRSHSIDLFTSILLLVALGIVFVSGVLLWHASSLLRSLQITTFDPQLSFRIPVPWMSVIITLVLTVFIGFSLHQHGDAEFRKSCELAGGTWHENVPMRDGKPTSDTAALGCMFGMGQGTFHITDADDLAFFARRSSPIARLTTDPAAPQAGVPVTLSFVFTDGNGQRVTGLTREHDRILHAVAISQDLIEMQHLHVEDSGPVTPDMLVKAVFPVKATFPTAGTYLIAVDYTVRSQTFSETFTVKVGNAGAAVPAVDLASPKAFGDVSVNLKSHGPLKAGTMQRLTYVFERDGKPVTDLEPYLAAAMHLSVVKTDLRRFIHTHAELPQPFLEALFSPRDPNARHVSMFLPDRFGPQLVAYVLFPVPGSYALFGEVNLAGGIVRTRFEVEVE